MGCAGALGKRNGKKRQSFFFWHHCVRTSRREPDFTDDGVLQVASFADLMATKVKVVLQRAEAKDYRDIAAMINADVSLAHGLASARQLYGSNFQPSESLKALVYFNDGDLNTLTIDEKNTLVEAVKVVRDLPEVTLRSKFLSGLS